MGGSDEAPTASLGIDFLEPLFFVSLLQSQKCSWKGTVANPLEHTQGGEE